MPVAEDAPTVDAPDEDEKGYRIVRTEEAVFAHHPGRRALPLPVRVRPVPARAARVARSCAASSTAASSIVVADDGLTLHHHGYTENLAHALLLAIDQPDAAAGHVFNVGDEEVLSIRQVIELVAARARARARDRLDAVRDRAAGAAAARAAAADPPRARHLARAQRVLGYRDVVPAREAIGRTARWLAEHPCEPGGQEEMVLTDPFDYAAEDRLIDVVATRASRRSTTPGSRSTPGYGLAYSGPGGRPRTNAEFDA